jgi:hypothetical protein
LIVKIVLPLINDKKNCKEEEVWMRENAPWKLKDEEV